MTEYDPGAVRDYADQLYLRANWIIGEYIMGGALSGGAVGGICAYLSTTDPSKLSSTMLGAVVGAAVLGYLFYMVGKQKALQLKAQAQQMLCWLTIEMNTRPDTEHPSANEPPPLLDRRGERSRT